MKSKLLTVLVLVSAWPLVQCGGAEERKALTDSGAGNSISVQTETVAEVSRAGTLEVTGTVRSKVVTAVSSKLLGALTRLTVDEGDRVQKGQVIAEIDDREARAQMAQAEGALAESKAALVEVENAIKAAESAREATRANATLSESTFKRFQELFQRNSVSRQEFDEVEARYKAAQAQLAQATESANALRSRVPQVQAKAAQAESMVEQARIFQSYSRVAAPFSGVISAKHAEVGEIVSPGRPLVTLEDSGSFEVEAVVPESSLRLVKTRLAVPVQIAALGFDGQGTVEEVVPRADPMTRSVVVKVKLPRIEGLHSGMFATVGIPGDPAVELTVPDSSVVRRGQLTGVYLVTSDSRAHFRLIKAGRTRDGRIEVLSGVKDGDRVIVSPVEGIQDGSSVRSAGN